ncbi:MAG: hypothetical protein PHU28_07045 [Methanosarcinaceae archaeon]|nr:hypothetical protein [Methanosarcinaceae archaeon]
MSSPFPFSLVSGEIIKPQEPSEEEKKLFLAITKRLLNSAARNILPHPIDDVLKSLSGETFFKEIDCSCFPDSKVEKVRLGIKTQVIHWDGTQSQKLGYDSLGAYSWNNCRITVKKKIKTFNFTNYLMLNAEKLGLNEKESFGQIENEGLLYHELLHGQLLIDAMQENSDWQQKVCKHDFDFAPVDMEHRFIYDLQSDFMKKSALDRGYELSVKRMNLLPRKSNNFEFLLGDISELFGKGDITLLYYVPPNCGISELEFELPEDSAGKLAKKGPIKLKGKISDKKASGKCYYWILKALVSQKKKK